jgi:hypothetical protein
MGKPGETIIRFDPYQSVPRSTKSTESEPLDDGN